MQMPQINVSNTVFDQLKELAEPFVDTPETVISRLIDHYHKSKGENKPSKYKGANNNHSMHYPIDAPPNLKFTRVTEITLDGEKLSKQLLYWNAFLYEVVRRAAQKLPPNKLRQAIAINYADGEKSDNGYRYIPEAGVSIQGQDANYAWKATAQLVKATGLNVHLVFQWEDKDQAARPGQTGHIVYEAA
jgi:hypothetical protein